MARWAGGRVVDRPSPQGDALGWKNQGPSAQSETTLLGRAVVRRDSRRIRITFGLLAVLCLFLTGCPDRQTPEESNPMAAVGTIRLAVVDDPALAEAIEKYRGEWKGQTGADYTVEQVTSSQLNDFDAITGDAVICPSDWLGEFAADDGVVPVPDELRKAESSQWGQVFSLLRTREAVWGRNVLGVPFGSPVFVCYCRADLLESLGREPPETWAEYAELAELLGKQESLGQSWFGSLEPLEPGWGGKVLLARAAAYATHPENYSTVFEIDTMKPLVAGPPFVRALEELAAAARGSTEQLNYNPTDVREAFWKGRCGLALTWPMAAGGESTEAAEGVRVQLAELPGSADVYDFLKATWQRRDDDDSSRVPLLGIAGRLGLVTHQSRWPQATAQLLFWLSDNQHATDIAAASPMTTMPRPPKSNQASRWVEPQIPPATAVEYAELTQRALSRRQCLPAVRIPGHAEYMSALDEAVAKAVRGELDPQEALAAAAARWDEITDRMVREKQAAAYDAGLGLR